MKIHQLTTYILHSCLVILYSLDVIKIFSLPWSLSFQTLHSIFSPFLILKTEEWNSHQIRNCNLSILTHYFFKKKKKRWQTARHLLGYNPDFCHHCSGWKNKRRGFFGLKIHFSTHFHLKIRPNTIKPSPTHLITPKYPKINQKTNINQMKNL